MIVGNRRVLVNAEGALQQAAPNTGLVRCVDDLSNHRDAGQAADLVGRRQRLVAE